MMKAVQITNYGGIDAINIEADAPQPILKPGQVSVEVHAASLNRIDSFLRNGYMQQMMPLPLPITLGGDFAGVVSEIGEGVTDLKVGDAVFGIAGVYRGGSGSLAEVVTASSGNTFLQPTSFNHTQSAALPLAGTSALQGIEDELKVQAEQKILIQGGAGGIGSFAIQIAKLHGAYVAATVGTKDVEFAKSLGADEVIDYKTQDVTQVLKDYDAVFDTAGGETRDKLFAVLKKGGTLVSMAGQPDQKAAKKHKIHAIGQRTATSSEQLKRLAELVDGGHVKVYMEKIFPLEQARAAFEYFETQHPKGKVVVEIK